MATAQMTSARRSTSSLDWGVPTSSTLGGSPLPHRPSPSPHISPARAAPAAHPAHVLQTVGLGDDSKTITEHHENVVKLSRNKCRNWILNPRHKPHKPQDTSLNTTLNCIRKQTVEQKKVGRLRRRSTRRGNALGSLQLPPTLSIAA